MFSREEDTSNSSTQPRRLALISLALAVWVAVTSLAASTSPDLKITTYAATPLNVISHGPVAGGGEIEVLVAYRNIGTATWEDTGGDAITLNLADDNGNPHDAILWQMNPTGMVHMPIAPGQTAFFEATLTAPGTVGTYDLQFDLKHGGTWFGSLSLSEPVEVNCPIVMPGTGEGVGNGAQLVSLETPAEVAVGGEFEVRAIVRNTGTNCWNDLDLERPYLIGRTPPPAGGPDGTWPGFHRHPVDPALFPVKPGDEVTLSYIVKAPTVLPSQPTHTFEARMIQPRAPQDSTGYGWFGLPESNNITVTDSPSLDAKVVDVDAPAVVVPGEKYTVWVTMRNTGSATWEPTGTSDSEIVLGMPINPTTWGPSRHTLSDRVLPNQQVTFEFEIQAPSSVGTENLQWQMLEVGTDWFGTETIAEQPEQRDMSHPITTLGDRFVVNNPHASSSEEFVMRGFNYLPYYEFEVSPPPTGSPQAATWRHYKEEVTEREFRDMARLGANTVRFWAPDEYLELDDPALTQEQARARLNHALDTAYRNGLRTVLSMPVNRELIVDAHCPPGGNELCYRNVIGRAAVLFYEDDFRDTIVARNLQVLDDLEVLDTVEPRLLAIEFWQEPSTGDTAERRKLSPSREWHEYVVETYCDPQTTTCCLPTDPGCDVNTTLASAFAANNWNHNAATDCGDPRLPGDTTYLCAPDDGELCSGDAQSSWATMTADYRRFVDTRAYDTYAYAIDELDQLILAREAAAVPGTVIPKPMVTLGFASQFARGAGQHEDLCGDRGYFLDPRFRTDLFDYASIHLYPWSDLSRPFVDAIADESLAGFEPEKRYHQMRFLLDYIRAGRPVVLEEMGYNTCKNSPVDVILATGEPGAEAGGCTILDTRDPIQQEVWTLEAENLAQMQANGALYWVYRDRIDRGQWGAKRLDDSEKPVYQVIPQLMQTLENGRDMPTASRGCIVVDPYAVPNWNHSLMRSFDAYLTLADDGTGTYGHVEVRVDACPFGGTP